MNKNIAIIVATITIFLAAYILYWRGEKSIEEAAANFSILAFENTDLTCDSGSLEFFLRNNQRSPISLEVSILSNDEVLKKSAHEVSAQTLKLVKPDQGIISKACSTENTRYEIIVETKEGKENIYKLLSL